MDRREFIGNISIAGMSAAAAGSSACARKSSSRDGPPPPSLRARRLDCNPIIPGPMDERMQEEARLYGYVNINGPSLIRAPDWAPDPLGKYYLFFAHHKGGYIRLAFADDLCGPWRTREQGCLQLEQSHFPAEDAGAGSAMAALSSVWKEYQPAVAWAVTKVGLAARLAVAERKSEGTYGSSETRPHIASPEIVVDNEKREIRMYYHGMLADSNQMTRVAVSRDGIIFRARPELLCGPYLRVFPYRGMYYGVWMPGLFCRSRDGLSKFETRPRLMFGANMRHCALLRRGTLLYVFFTRVGDAPERILCSKVDISPKDWDKWEASEPAEVLRPEKDWEGAELPVSPSIRGEITGPVNELRDPAIYEEDGRTFLLYSCAGEQTIAIAELFTQS